MSACSASSDALLWLDPAPTPRTRAVGPCPAEFVKGRRAAVEEEVEATGARRAPPAGARAAAGRADVDDADDGVAPRLRRSRIRRAGTSASAIADSTESRQQPPSSPCRSLSSSPANGVVLLSRPVGIPELLEPLAELEVVLHLALHKAFDGDDLRVRLEWDRIHVSLEATRRRQTACASADDAPCQSCAA